MSIKESKQGEPRNNPNGPVIRHHQYRYLAATRYRACGTTSSAAWHSDTFMSWDNKNRAFGFMKDPFANTTHKKLIHRTASMRTDNNHIYIEFRGLIEHCFYRCTLHKKGCCIQACPYIPVSRDDLISRYERHFSEQTRFKSDFLSIIMIHILNTFEHHNVNSPIEYPRIQLSFRYSLVQL